MDGKIKKPLTFWLILFNLWLLFYVGVFGRGLLYNLGGDIKLFFGLIIMAVVMMLFIGLLWCLEYRRSKYFKTLALIFLVLIIIETIISTYLIFKVPIIIQKSMPDYRHEKNVSLIYNLSYLFINLAWLIYVSKSSRIKEIFMN